MVAPARREAAFSIIEVIISVLILAFVVSAIALSAAGGQKSRGAARLQSSLTKAGQQAHEDLATNREWMKSCAKSCKVGDFIEARSLKLDDVDGSAVIVDATAEAVDSPVDLEGKNDRDGVVPDYYRLVVLLKFEDALLKRYGIPDTVAPRRFMTSIDRRGVTQVGSLVVEACRVTNQSDERMSIQGCAKNGPSYVRMYQCPPEESAREGCWNAWNWVKGKGPDPGEPSPYVSMSRVPPSKLLPFDLVNVLTGEKTAGTKAEQVDGTLVFQNLEAGEYRLEGLPATYMKAERWKSKEVPAYHGADGDPAAGATIAVEPGLRNRALALYRPPSTKAGIKFFFKRTTTTRVIGGAFQSPPDVAVKPWEPTDGYIGGGAQAYCDEANSKKGAESMIKYDYCTPFGESGGSNCTAVIWQYDVPKEQIFNEQGSSRHCTYYHQYLIHHYYKPVTKTSLIRNGAAQTAVYQVEPKPDIRIADNLKVPIDVCVTKGHKKGTPDQSYCSPAIDDLRPGLNSSVFAPKKGLIGGNNQSAALINQNVSGTPEWLVHGGLWVYPNGTIQSSNGLKQPLPNPTVTLIGTGECYWRNPLKYSGEVEGSCDPCNPMWTKGGTLVGACTVLTKTCWYRPAKEVRYMEGYGAVQEWPLVTRWGCFNYSTPWKCTGVPRIVNGGNCKPPSPPPSIPKTKHPTPAGGTALVNGSPLTSSPGGG